MSNEARLQKKWKWRKLFVECIQRERQVEWRIIGWTEMQMYRSKIRGKMRKLNYRPNLSPTICTASHLFDNDIWRDYSWNYFVNSTNVSEGPNYKFQIWNVYLKIDLVWNFILRVHGFILKRIRSAFRISTTPTLDQRLHLRSNEVSSKPVRKERLPGLMRNHS